MTQATLYNGKRFNIITVMLKIEGKIINTLIGSKALQDEVNIVGDTDYDTRYIHYTDSFNKEVLYKELLSKDIQLLYIYNQYTEIYEELVPQV